MNKKERELKIKEVAEEIVKDKASVGSENIEVRHYIRDLSEEEIVKPNIQRDEQYSVKKKSAIIESIFRGIPIPPLCIIERCGGKKELVDGLQRTSSIVGYVNGEFPLRGMQYYKVLEGLYFKELPTDVQAVIKNYKLYFQKITEKPDTDKNFVRDVFVAINKGSEELSLQQIREAVYYGEFIEELRNFAKENDKWIQDTIVKPSEGISKKKGQHLELILGCIANADLYFQSGVTKMSINNGDKIDMYLRKNQNNEEANNILQECKSILDFIKNEIGYKCLMTQDYKRKYNETKYIQIGRKIIICLYTLLKTNTLSMEKIRKDKDNFRRVIGNIVGTEEFNSVNRKSKGGYKYITQKFIEGLSKDFA